MATTIQNFFAAAASKQFARDFLFRVNSIRLAGGVEINASDTGTQNDLIYARSAALPGRTIENKEVNYMGLTFNVPGRATYSNSAAYSIEFYADADCSLREKMEDASRAVFDDATSTGDYGMPGQGEVINLQVIDKALNPVPKGKLRLVGASIREIGDIGYSIADGTGEVINFPVSFSYHYYTMAGHGEGRR
tara:strand:- start:1302 stop:1877 length:576 start_codon:yes stop_codon:yes gene_type:complete